MTVLEKQERTTNCTVRQPSTMYLSIHVGGIDTLRAFRSSGFRNPMVKRHQQYVQSKVLPVLYSISL